MLQKLQFPNADLLLQGAQLMHFKDWLFFPSNPDFEAGKSFHGGVPVIFPWFGPNKNSPKAPSHGWARNSVWTVGSQSQNDVVLVLEEDHWRVQLRYEFGDTLTARVEVLNLAQIARSFEIALHTYFAVSNVSAVEIEGLDGLTYLDKPDNHACKTQSGSVQFEGEVDRVYLNAPSPLFIRDGATGFALRGDWKSAVTWNPAREKGSAMSDLGEDGWKRFVCLEVGAIADDAVTLEPNQTWMMNMEVVRTG